MIKTWEPSLEPWCAALAALRAISDRERMALCASSGGSPLIVRCRSTFTALSCFYVLLLRHALLSARHAVARIACPDEAPIYLPLHRRWRFPFRFHEHFGACFLFVHSAVLFIAVGSGLVGESMAAFLLQAGESTADGNSVFRGLCVSQEPADGR